MGAEVDYQVAAPAELRTPNLHRAKKSLNKECGWKDGDRGGLAQTQEPTGRKKRKEETERRKKHLTLTGLLMEGLSLSLPCRMMVTARPESFPSLRKIAIADEADKACNSSGVLFEVVKRHLSILADLDEVAVGIAHVTTPFPTVIVERFGEEDRSLGAPLFVTGPNVGDAQVEEAVHRVEIRRGFEEDCGLIGRRATTGIENDPGIGQPDVAGIFRLDHFSAKNSDVKVLRFFLIPHGEEMRDQEAFVCNRRVGQIHTAASCEELEPKERIPQAPSK
jgi:hypothetical protein